MFTHADGTEVALEIVGYWTPEYLGAQAPQARRRVRGVNLIVAVPRPLAVRAGALPADGPALQARMLLRDLLPRLEAFRAQAPGGDGDPTGRSA